MGWIRTARRWAVALLAMAWLGVEGGALAQGGGGGTGMPLSEPRWGRVDRVDAAHGEILLKDGAELLRLDKSTRVVKDGVDSSLAHVTRVA